MARLKSGDSYVGRRERRKKSRYRRQRKENRFVLAGIGHARHQVVLAKLWRGDF